MDDNLVIKPKGDIDPSEFDIGVIIARFQVHKLHIAHIKLIELVSSNHKKVILFLGVPNVQNTERNPLDFATRKAMIQSEFPKLVILPAKDQRSNEIWSQRLDESIEIPFGNKKALLYGARDSFIPFYEGKHKTMELVSNIFLSGTETRKEVSREILSSSDFRAGVIHSCSAQYPVAYPCVDVAPLKEEDGQTMVLLAQKPNELKWRFVGGHVDPSDDSLERAANREFIEETGGCEIGELTYVTSKLVNDWRYKSLKSDIMSTLFVGTFRFGSPRPTDDISALKWFPLNEAVMQHIIEEHEAFMLSLLNFKNII